MLSGRIGRARDLPGYWWAECEEVRAYTQGTSREDALSMLADCIELMADGAVKVTVTEVGPVDADEISVSIACDNPELLADLVRRQQR